MRAAGVAGEGRSPGLCARGILAVGGRPATGIDDLESNPTDHIAPGLHRPPNDSITDCAAAPRANVSEDHAKGAG